MTTRDRVIRCYRYALPRDTFNDTDKADGSSHGLRVYETRRVISNLEDEFKVDISDHEFSQIDTIADLVSYLEATA